MKKHLMTVTAIVVCIVVGGAVSPLAAQKGSTADGWNFPVPRLTPQRKDVKPFTYVEAKIPFYAPGGARRGNDAWNKMQLPVTPEESVKHMVVPEGFEVKLFAAEPDIVRPVCMAWDERGRLWIAESLDYPNNRQPAGKGHDHIKICEDTNGDGRADKFTIFADKLSIPTSICFSRGGIIVHQAPQTLFLKDTDGDDKADVRKILFEGWNTRDTHAGPSNLQYGLDNWIWGMQGYAGFSGTVGKEYHRFRQGFYRFKPDGSKLEFLRSTNNNTWGIGFSEEGIVFGSTANGNPSVYLPIPNRYYEQVRGWSASVLGTIAETHRFRPITKKVRQVDYHGGYTAAAGHALYTARTYPRDYWNRTAFVNGPTGHLLGTFILRREGADFESKYLFNLLASNDEWTAPTMAEIGPDGNVWIIDWYNYIVQHNPTPAGFRTGKGNAYETPLRDKKHGRIYRIVYKGTKPQAAFSLQNAAPGKLVETLKNDNMLWRKHAQRLLVERGKLDVLPALIELAKDNRVDAIGLNTGAIHALWTMQGLGALDGKHENATAAAVKALTHKSAGVRRNAVLVLPPDKKSSAAILQAKLLADVDAQVRLAALLALAEMPADARAGQAIAAMIARPINAEDRWIPDAATSAAAQHDTAFLASLCETKGAPEQALKIAGIVAEHHARGEPKKIGSLVRALTNSPPKTAEVIIAGLARGWPKAHQIHLDAATDKDLSRLFKHVSAGTQSQLIVLASRWGSKQLESYAGNIVANLLTVVGDAKRLNSVRLKAAEQLISFRPNDPKVVTKLLDQISPQTSLVLAQGLLEALEASRAKNVGAEIVERLVRLTPSAKKVAIRVLLRRPETTTQLLDGIEKGKLQFSELSLDQKRILSNHPNLQIARRATKLISQGGGLPNPDRQKVLEALLPLVKKKGDPKRGKLVFTMQCAKCHSHGGEGKNIGPDLTGMAVHPKEELLTHIIDPSRSVEGNFRNYVVVLKDGQILTGLLASETKTTLELLDAEAKKHVVQRQEIDELVASKKSFMPDGFEKQISRDDLANLLEFLTQHGKYVPLDLRRVATIVSTRGMFYSKDSTVERLVFRDWKPKTFDGVPFHFVDPQGSRVANVIMLYGPQGKFPPKMPKKVSLPCNTAAKAIHFLSGVSGWGAQGEQENGRVTMIVRLHYKDGKTEDHKLINGRHFADYIRRIDVPKSKFAFALRGRQMRYLAIHPQRSAVIDQIELVKGNDRSAPIVMAITVETRGE